MKTKNGEIMKSFLLVMALVVSGSVVADVEGTKVQSKIETKREPASAEFSRLIEIDERRGCCSHHGGVSSCSGGTLYCNDGTVSGCGC